MGDGAERLQELDNMEKGCKYTVSATVDSQQIQKTALGLKNGPINRQAEMEETRRGPSPSQLNYFQQTDSGAGEAIAFSCRLYKLNSHTESTGQTKWDTKPNHIMYLGKGKVRGLGGVRGKFKSLRSNRDASYT